MSDNNTAAEKILESSQEPKRIKGDEGEFENHSIPDQIAAVKFAASQKSASNPFAVIKKGKIAFGGID